MNSNKEITDWTKDPQFIPHIVTKLSVCEAVYALREAWFAVYKEYPSDESLGVLFGKSALETGRWNFMHNFNFGNIKKKHLPTNHDNFTMFRCFEVIKGEKLWFDPPHIQTHFVAYKSIVEGAIGYILFVSSNPRYSKAWQKVIDGDPVGYAHELKTAGYYTADETEYTHGVLKLYHEFMDKKTLLLAWKPEEIHKPEHTPEPVHTNAIDVDISAIDVDIRVPEVIVQNEDNTKDGKKIDATMSIGLFVLAILSTVYYNCQHLFQ